MIDAATTANTAQKPDAAYKSWQSSMGKAVMRHDPEARTAAPIPTFGSMVHQTNALAAQGAHAYAPGEETTDANSTPDIAYKNEESDEYTFSDLLDMINPLQHLPVIGTLYRKFTGDTIKPMSNIIGGAIFGGPVGAVSSTVNVVMKSTTGKDIAENAFAMAGFDVTTDGGKKPVISYDKTASFAPANHLAAATDIKIASVAIDAYKTASGQRNFAARTVSTETWNA